MVMVMAHFWGYQFVGIPPPPYPSWGLLNTNFHQKQLSLAQVWSRNGEWNGKGRGFLNAHLPSSKGYSAITDGQGEVRPKKTSLWPEMVFSHLEEQSGDHLGVGGHVVRAFTGVLEWNLLGHEPVGNVSSRGNDAENKVCAVAAGGETDLGGGGVCEVQCRVAQRGNNRHNHNEHCWDQGKPHNVHILRSFPSQPAKKEDWHWRPLRFDVAAQS